MTLTGIPAHEALISSLTVDGLSEVRASGASLVEPGAQFWLIIQDVAPYTGVGFIAAYLNDLYVLDP